MTTYQAHARRLEKAAVKAELREVAPEDFGECGLCGFIHLYPAERGECAVCGGTTCRGDNWVCGRCGSSEPGGKLMSAVGAACANTGPRGDIFTPSKRRSHAAQG